MDRGLGSLLFVLMSCAVALVSIAAAAVREATLEPGLLGDGDGKRPRIATSSSVRWS